MASPRALSTRLPVEARASHPVVVAIPGDEALNPNVERSSRLKSGRLLQRLHVGISLRHVAGLRRQELDLGLPAEGPLDRGDIVEQGDRAVIADIVDAV